MDSSSENNLVSLSELAVLGSEGATEMRLLMEGLVVRGACAIGGLDVKIGVPGGRSMSNVDDLETGESGDCFAGSIEPCAL
jgi:hypothetical protein